MALFQPGQSGNPAGRPPGARSKFSEAFIRALAEDFAEHGKNAIERCRTEKPGEYLRVAASLVPKSLVGDAMPVDLGDVASAAGLVEAMGRVMAAMSSGMLSIEQAKALADILETQRKAIETTEFEARLREIEGRAGINAPCGRSSSRMNGTTRTQ